MTAPPVKTIRVIVIDDSALVRSLLGSILDADPQIEVVATAADPYEARERIKQFNPDVITLDIEMPKMNGLEFLEKIMKLRPMPVVMFSSLTQRGAEATIRAMELGAVETIAKPSQITDDGFRTIAADIVGKIKEASLARPRPAAGAGCAAPSTLAHRPGMKNRGQVIAIGASTGGVEAIREIFSLLPPTLPPILITQHMPPSFMEPFAQRLNRISKLQVTLARPHMALRPGCAYVAPGEHHLALVRKGEEIVTAHGGDQRINGHCPSVDAMFLAVADSAGAQAVGVLLTGMGADGAEGLLALRRKGAVTLGQSEASCVVYGMPRKAQELGAVQKQYALGEMAQAIVAAC